MYKRFTSLIDGGNAVLTKRPAVSFFGLILVLFGLIALGNFLRTPGVPEQMKTEDKKETALFIPRTDTAYLSVPAEVKKESIINIVALAPGIVSTLYTTPGRFVSAGQTLLQITNDYQSGGASLQKQIAQNNDLLIQKLASIDKHIFDLKEKQTKHNDTLTSTAEKIELRQLERDRDQSKMNLENSALGLRLTNVSDAVLKPKTFASGRVEKIYVRRGDLVSAGEVLVTIHTTAGVATLEALVSRKTASLFDPTQEAHLTINGETLSLLPTYFSQSETQNGLFSILFTLSDETRNKISNGEFLQIDLPLRANNASSILAPIDAIFQNESGASVLVEENGVAETKTITLGNIYGSFVEVTGGLTPDVHIILSRSVITGDSVTTR